MQGAESWTQWSLVGPFQLDIFLLKISLLICSIVCQLCSNEGILYCPLLFQWVKQRMEKDKDLSELWQVAILSKCGPSLRDRRKSSCLERTKLSGQDPDVAFVIQSSLKSKEWCRFSFCSLLLLELQSKVHVPDWLLKAINEKWHFKIIVARSCSSELSYCMLKAHSFPKVRYKKEQEYVCVCACVWVWDTDRFPTWKWFAIIRHAVTRGYVRQLKLCFLTETWFMLLVVTVTTSKWDRNQTQTKGWRNQRWLNTAILLIPSAFETAFGLSAVEVSADSEDFWSYRAGASVLVAFAAETAGAAQANNAGHALLCSQQSLWCSAGGWGSCEQN